MQAIVDLGGKRFSWKRRQYVDPHEVDADEDPNLLAAIVTGEQVMEKAKALRKLQKRIVQEPFKERRKVEGEHSVKHKEAIFSFLKARREGKSSVKQSGISAATAKQANKKIKNDKLKMMMAIAKTRK
mmetsp:Transcript_49378/g.127296  ORF Transcript_49378/g.127296 Transcript_49378/m.127296 type:complete len:128 (-) Transcript_49378:923-1306(-)